MVVNEDPFARLEGARTERAARLIDQRRVLGLASGLVPGSERAHGRARAGECRLGATRGQESS